MCGCRLFLGGAAFVVPPCFLSQKSKSPNGTECERWNLKQMSQLNAFASIIRVLIIFRASFVARRRGNLEHLKNLTVLRLHSPRNWAPFVQCNLFKNVSASPPFSTKFFFTFVQGTKRRQWFIRRNHFEVGALFHLPKKANESYLQIGKREEEKIS